MRLYHIDDNYIAYIKNFDSKVLENKNQRRPYVGIVLDINGIKYYAPLSSPKNKHAHMNNGKDFRKIHQGVYGVINFNNMIPVPMSTVTEINFLSVADEKYRRLLQNQYRCIMQDKQNIESVANNLYSLYMSDENRLSTNDKQIKQRCCNFALLEEKCKEYEQSRG